VSERFRAPCNARLFKTFHDEAGRSYLFVSAISIFATIYYMLTSRYNLGPVKNCRLLEFVLELARLWNPEAILIRHNSVGINGS